MDQDQKRMFAAVGLSGLVLFAWQVFFAPPVPVQAVKTPKNQEARSQEIKQELMKPTTVVETGNENFAPKSVQVKKYQEFSLSGGKESMLVIDSSLALKSLSSTLNTKSLGELTDSSSPLEIGLLTDQGVKSLFFVFSKNEQGQLVAKDTRYDVSVKVWSDSEGRFNYSLISPHNYRFRFTINTEEKKLENQKIRQLIYLTKSVDRVDIGDEEETSGNVKWFGIDFNYHLFVSSFSEKETVKITTHSSGVWVDMVNPQKNLDGYFIYSRKNYDSLTKLGDNLNLSVDFGIFGILAVPILKGIQAFYRLIPNYGLAIIAITLLIRLLTFPLQYKSFKSMKKMQKIQPELTKLREKFKDDPQRMQKETMELFKRAGANPLGGCLPLVAQMPFFFAIYQVLQNSVELVEAPFLGWIVDLSEKDPFYVLPVLMGIAMFGQTKLNPSTTADPTQQKVMMFMPIVFCFIMKDLPAGLNLYILVSTLFGIAQQLFVYKTTD